MFQTHKTLIVHDDDDGTAVYGTTPRHNTLSLTGELHWGDEITFTPVQKYPTRDAKTTIIKNKLSCQMWIVSENPRLVRLFGNKSPPKIVLPEKVLVLAQQHGQDVWADFECALMGNNLILPQFENLPVLIKFETELTR